MIPWANRITPYPKQQAAIFDPPGDAIIESSPKAGKTIACLQWIVEETAITGGDNHRFLWVAPVFSQARIVFRRAYLELLQRDEVGVLKNPPEITLPDGSVIVFASGDRDDNLYGEDYYGLVVDEGTRLHEESWIAAQSTLGATDGRIRIIANIKDRRNWAHRLAREVEAGKKEGWSYARLVQEDAMAAGVVSEESDKRIRNRISDDTYRQLYQAEVGDDGVLQIDTTAIDRAEVPEMVTWCRAWDFAVTVGGDWTVGAKVAANHEGFWITDIVRERVEAGGVVNLIRQTAALDGPEVIHVIEEEKGASGRLFLDTITTQLYEIPTAGSVWPAGVEQNKIVRAWPMAMEMGMGKWHLAPDLYAGELMPELEQWPDSRYDDQIDALAHARNYLAP